MRRPIVAVTGAWYTVRHRQLSPLTFRWIARAAVWALVATIISGATVRLTGSGMGCPDWPACTTTSVVAPWQFHAWVEFANRLVNAAVTIASVGAVVAALARAPRRRDLTLLSLGLLGGLAAEVVLGGVTVEHHLAPGFVMAHYLLAVVFLAEAVLLDHRARIADSPTGAGRARAAGPAMPLVPRWQRLAAAALGVNTAVVLALGTVVTSTGPHAGAPGTPRFHLSLHTVAQLHGGSVEVLLALTVLTLWALQHGHAPAEVLRRGELLLLALVAQGAIGYTQYFTGVPAGLVELHEIGAILVVVAVLRFNLGLHRRPTPARPTPVAPSAQAAGGTDRLVPAS